MLYISKCTKNKAKIKDKTINLESKLAKTINEQTKGLMFEKKSKFNYALIFYFKNENRFLNSIHMFFVFFPILCIFLDKEKRVVDKKILKPFYPFYMPKKNCKYLIEMPKKYTNKINLNDKIKWQ